MNDSSLDEIGLQAGTDKSSAHHDYLRHYERHLRAIPKPIKTLLEIGVYDGASIRMWREFLPDTKIIGVDIEERALVHAGGNVAIEICDQSDVVALGRLISSYAPFDVVVDDGSHVWSHQILSFETLFPFVNSGGTYIIEDIDTSFGHYVSNYGRDSQMSAAQYVTKLGNYVIGADAACPEQELDLRMRVFARRVESLTMIKRSVLIQSK